MKYPLWDDAEVFNGYGSLALQIRSWDLMYCNRVEVQHDEETRKKYEGDPYLDGLPDGQHQVWINAIIEAPKAYALLQHLVDLQDIGTFYAICDEAREILGRLDLYVDDADKDGGVGMTA